MGCNTSSEQRPEMSAGRRKLIEYNRMCGPVIVDEIGEIRTWTTNKPQPQLQPQLQSQPQPQLQLQHNFDYCNLIEKMKLQYDSNIFHEAYNLLVYMHKCSFMLEYQKLLNIIQDYVCVYINGKITKLLELHKMHINVCDYDKLILKCIYKKYYNSHAELDFVSRNSTDCETQNMSTEELLFFVEYMPQKFCISGDKFLFHVVHNSTHNIHNCIFTCPYIDINIYNDRGKTLLMSLIFHEIKSPNRYIRIIYYLLQNNRLDINAQDNHGNIALLYAIDKNNKYNKTQNKISESIGTMMLRSPTLNISNCDLCEMIHESHYLMFVNHPTFNSTCGTNLIKLTYYDIDVVTFEKIATKMLSYPKININKRCKYGMTALMHAIENVSVTNIILIKLLLEHPEIDVELCRYKDNITAFDLAKKYGDETVSQMLQPHYLKYCSNHIIHVQSA